MYVYNRNASSALAVHFEIAYNGDRIIEINVSTDPSQVVDISEDVVKVIPIRVQGVPLRITFSNPAHPCGHGTSTQPAPIGRSDMHHCSRQAI